jgi:hypothetical protein
MSEQLKIQAEIDKIHKNIMKMLWGYELHLLNIRCKIGDDKFRELPASNLEVLSTESGLVNS